MAITGLNVLNGAPGIFLASGAVSIKGGTFAGNTTAISTSYETRLSVTGATFTGNTGKYGGAIAAEWNAKLTNNIFTGNSAAQGGAVFVQGGNQTIAGCVFTDNTATYGGGGLYDDADVR